MSTKTRPRGGRRAGTALAALVGGVALVLAGCSTADETPGGGAAAIDDGDLGFLTQEQFDELTQRVEEWTAVPEFVPPGPAFDIRPAQGKRFLVMPTASQLPVCHRIAEDTVEIAGRFGLEGTYFENSGGPPGWIPGFQQAIAQDYDAILLTCGIDVDQIAPVVQEATAAGIAVIDSGLGDTDNGSEQNPLVTAQTNVPTAESSRRAIDVMLLENRAEPFDILLITSNDVPSGVIMNEAIEEEVKKYCPECGIERMNVAVPDWATQITPEVAARLTANPDIKVVVPIFDGEVPPVIAGITQSGRTDVTIHAAYGGTAEYISQMGEPGYPLRSDVGPTGLWRAYAAVDQMLRVLSGAGAVPPDKASDPSRVWTVDNHEENAGVNEGFGDEFIKGYESLWLTS